MPDTKITALTAISTVDPAVDVLPIVDVSDTTMAASGTTKKITSNQILGAGGTATLASATITGDLTVDTSTLKVDSTNNRVGIGTASPSTNLHVGSGTGLNNLGVGLSRGATTNFYEAYDGTKSFLAGTDSSQAGVKVGALTNHPLYLVSNNTPQLEITHPGLFVFNDGLGGTRMTLNSTGLGVGVTPSAWNSAAKAIQSSAGAVASNGITTWFGSNVFYDSTYTPKYIGTSFAGSIVYNPAGFGGWDFNIAASGTAGNTVTFSTPMKLDANGNLILLSSATPATLTVNGQLTVNATSNTNLRFSYRGSDGTTRVADITLA